MQLSILESYNVRWNCVLPVLPQMLMSENSERQDVVKDVRLDVGDGATPLALTGFAQALTEPPSPSKQQIRTRPSNHISNLEQRPSPASTLPRPFSRVIIGDSVLCIRKNLLEFERSSQSRPISSYHDRVAVHRLSSKPRVLSEINICRVAGTSCTVAKPIPSLWPLYNCGKALLALVNPAYSRGWDAGAQPVRYRGLHWLETEGLGGIEFWLDPSQ
jgi:hypothetical protein